MTDNVFARTALHDLFDQHIGRLGAVDAMAVANILCLAASAPSIAEDIAAELRETTPRALPEGWAEGEEHGHDRACICDGEHGQAYTWAFRDGETIGLTDHETCLTAPVDVVRWLLGAPDTTPEAR